MARLESTHKVAIVSLLVIKLLAVLELSEVKIVVKVFRTDSSLFALG